MDDSDRTAMLFREYHERLTRFARHLVGVGADADDLVQETFLKAHHYLCSGNDIRAPLSFLFVTMRNLVNDASRQKKIAMVEVSLDADEIAPDDETPSVERQVMSEREFERLCVAIADLPERMRHAFVLRKVYGYSCREIAEHLGRSTNTVREQVVQSFKKLHALRTCDGFGKHGARSRTSAEREQAKTKENDHVRPFSLTPAARREQSG
ncbi:MAG TPA: sigma-70 family RNA polymerase sigma factor [Woeseiaceae bacterium]|nr:sigma-70 family RNA polymerase sigma factor [Woeseiaceae bacterium]